MTRITLELSDELGRSLDELSRRCHRPVDDLVRDLLRRALAVEQFQELRQRNLQRLGQDAPATDAQAFEQAS